MLSLLAFIPKYIYIGLVVFFFFAMFIVGIAILTIIKQSVCQVRMCKYCKTIIPSIYFMTRYDVLCRLVSQYYRESSISLNPRHYYLAFQNISPLNPRERRCKHEKSAYTHTHTHTHTHMRGESNYCIDSGFVLYACVVHIILLFTLCACSLIILVIFPGCCSPQ